MAWIHMAANPGMGLEEQWLRRIGVVPAIALKRDRDDRWIAWILETTGISARAIYFAATLTLVEAQDAAMVAARETGWREE